MAQYKQKIDEALQFLLHPSYSVAQGEKPIACLVYNPEDILDMAYSVNEIQSIAEYYGFTKTVTLDMRQVIDDAIRNSKRFRFFSDDKRFKRETDLFSAIAHDIQSSECMSAAILAAQQRLEGEKLPLLVISGLEMLHPFERIGNFEINHYNDIQVPILVLYPGTSKGDARSYLGIYAFDGTYRSKNF